MNNKGKIVFVLLIGIIIGSSLSGVVFANLEKTINVITGIKLKVDGVDYVPRDANGREVEVFAYNGTTYLPVRPLSDCFGKNIEWDGKNRTVLLGKTEKNPDTEKFLGSKGMKYMNKKSSLGSFDCVYSPDLTYGVSVQQDSIGNKYENYLILSSYMNEETSYCLVEYPTTTKYRRFRATVAVSDREKGFSGSAKLSILADDEVVYEKVIKSGDMPEDIDVDIKKALKVGFKLEPEDISGDWTTSYIGLYNPRFVE